MSQFPPGPPSPNPEGQPPPGSPPPGWGQPPTGQPPGPPPGQPPYPGQPAPPPGATPPGTPPPGYPPTAGGPPSGPGWGGQPYPPATPPSGSGGGNGIKIIIGVAVIAVLAVGAFLILGGGDDSSGGGGPEQTVKDFFNAGAKGDCEGMIDLIAGSSFGGVGKQAAVTSCKEAVKNGESLFEGEDASLDSVKLKSEKGDNATVTVKSTTSGKSSTEDIQLVKEDGKWKIDFNALLTTGSTGTGDDDSSDVTGTTIIDPTDTSIDLGDFDLPEECQDPTSPDFDYEACAEALGNG